MFGFDTIGPVSQKTYNATILNTTLDKEGDTIRGKQIIEKLTQECQKTIQNVPIQKMRDNNKYFVGTRRFSYDKGTVGHALKQFLQSSARAYCMIGSYNEPKQLYDKQKYTDSTRSGQKICKGRLYVLFLPTISDKNTAYYIENQLFHWKSFLKVDGIVICTMTIYQIVKIKIGVESYITEEKAQKFIDELAHRYFESYMRCIWDISLKQALTDIQYTFDTEQ